MRQSDRRVIFMLRCEVGDVPEVNHSYSSAAPNHWIKWCPQSVPTLCKMRVGLLDLTYVCKSNCGLYPFILFDLFNSMSSPGQWISFTLSWKRCA